MYMCLKTNKQNGYNVKDAQLSSIWWSWALEPENMFDRRHLYD